MPADDDPAAPSPSPGAAPSRLQQAWQRLAKADEIVQGFGERGWVTPDTMAEVGRRTGEVARRIGRAEHDGADESFGLLHELEDLTALLVALADEAITRQPSLAPETPVPVSLEDARARRSSTHAAYDDLD